MENLFRAVTKYGFLFPRKKIQGNPRKLSPRIIIAGKLCSHNKLPEILNNKKHCSSLKKDTMLGKSKYF